MAEASAKALAATLLRLQTTLKGVLPAPGATIRSVPTMGTVQADSPTTRFDSPPFEAAGPEGFSLPFLHVTGAHANPDTPDNEAD